MPPPSRPLFFLTVFRIRRPSWDSADTYPARLYDNKPALQPLTSPANQFDHGARDVGTRGRRETEQHDSSRVPLVGIHKPTEIFVLRYEHPPFTNCQVNDCCVLSTWSDFNNGDSIEPSVAKSGAPLRNHSSHRPERASISAWHAFQPEQPAKFPHEPQCRQQRQWLREYPRVSGGGMHPRGLPRGPPQRACAGSVRREWAYPGQLASRASPLG